MIKTCFKCKSKKKISSFYKHPKMKDGYLNKCKECTKIDVVTNRALNLKYYTEYDRVRAMLPHRVSDRIVRSSKNRKAHPGKVRSRTAVSNAIRDCKIQKQPCVKCGDINSTAHHPDYRKPLDVVWLCWKHHGEMHRKYDYEKLISTSHQLQQEA